MDSSQTTMIERRSWEEFRGAGLLWWINRLLHTFGWVIVAEVQPDGRVTDMYPARTKFRGFSASVESEGFQALSEHIVENAATLRDEAKS